MAASSRLRLTACTVLALVAVAACTTTASRTETTATPSAAGGHPVATTTLDLRDDSRPTVPDPATGTGRLPYRELPTIVWYPSSGKGPFPVVVFSHGRASRPEAYSALLSAWAAAGFVVAAPRFPLTSEGSPLVTDDVVNQSADVSFVLTQVLDQNTADGSPLEGLLDAGHVAAAGHSAGAVTTLGLLTTCCTDARIDAVVVLAGASVNYILPGYTPALGVRFTTPGIPALFVHGAADDAIPISQGKAIYEDVPGPKAFVTLTGGTHSAPYDDQAHPDWETVRAVTTDYLTWTLKGDTDALQAVRADAGRSGRAELSDDRLSG